MDFFLRGTVLGFMISAPVGPIGLLCIRRTAQRGLMVGFATGLGAATADAFFGALATFGVAVILGWLQGLENEIRIFGGIILAFMAGNAWGKKPHFSNNEDTSVGTMLRAFISGLALTCTNPVTILATLAVIATLGGQLNHYQASMMTGGIFMGAAAWWMLLAGGVALFRRHFTERTILMINRSTAVLLMVISVYALVTGIHTWLGTRP
jgi:threonine/homoserine/homoserine lactone efflux protein